MENNVLMEGEEKDLFDVFDVNWSNDGTTVAAGLDKSVIMLDVAKLLSQPAEKFQNPHSSQG